MRKVEQRSRYRRDYKREGRGIYRKVIEPPDGELWNVVIALANNMSLPQKYRDHLLAGEYEGCRECHVKPDLLLVYRYEGEDLLILERLGSHSEIFGM